MTAPNKRVQPTPLRCGFKHRCVFLAVYWANHDQYYVKTGEYFTDYTYQAPGGVTVHFKLQQADVEQNNVKGEKRFFLPVLDEISIHPKDALREKWE